MRKIVNTCDKLDVLFNHLWEMVVYSDRDFPPDTRLRVLYFRIMG